MSTTLRTLNGVTLALGLSTGLPTLAQTASEAPTSAPTSDPQDWNLHWQTTLVDQTKASMRAAYSGEHSLLTQAEHSRSWTATAALGLRLGARTEAYLDPEIAAGVPLSGLQGLAGFTNGEMARSSGADPKLYRARAFLRHVVDLSDDTETVAPGFNQLGGIYGSRRLVLTAGNLSVTDIFDANAYAHDPRTQFLNWTVMSQGAFDFAADARGYTWGAAAEFIDGDWSVRAGRFLLPKLPNQQKLDKQLGQHHGDQIELEHRHSLGEERSGAVRVLAFRDRAVMGRYADALDLAAATQSTPSLDLVRHSPQLKYGLGASFDQQAAADVGVFGRAMWADGRTETYAFTEVDRSVSGGASVKGEAWSRPQDVVGLALAVNGLSGVHRQYLSDGGTAFFLGDGRLRYRHERVLEAYYALSLGPWAKGSTVSIDHQHIANPGYNADRGPASFWALRFHTEL